MMKVCEAFQRLVIVVIKLSCEESQAQHDSTAISGTFPTCVHVQQGRSSSS